MERKTVPLRFCKSKVPLVTFRLAGVEHYAIIDTGSEITMLNVDLKDIIKTKEVEGEGSMVGVNGKNEYSRITQGACSANLETTDGEQVSVVLGGVLYDMKALSSHFRDKNGEYIPISAIIGGEFLKHYNAKIDYKKKTLTIDG